jgi:hypothetical protein
MTNDKGDKMSTPKYPHIKVSMNHRGTDPLAVLMKVSYEMKAAGVPVSELNDYLKAILTIVNGDVNNFSRAAEVVRESLKWVALTD